MVGTGSKFSSEGPLFRLSDFSSRSLRFNPRSATPFLALRSCWVALGRAGSEFERKAKSRKQQSANHEGELTRGLKWLQKATKTHKEWGEFRRCHSFAGQFSTPEGASYTDSSRQFPTIPKSEKGRNSREDAKTRRGETGWRDGHPQGAELGEMRRWDTSP